MLNTIVLITFCVLLVVFLAMSALALRHTAKFAYISRGFKTLAWIFGLVAVVIIILSIYLLTKLLGPAPGTVFPKTSVTDINY